MIITHGCLGKLNLYPRILAELWKSVYTFFILWVFVVLYQNFDSIIEKLEKFWLFISLFQLSNVRMFFFS